MTFLAFTFPITSTYILFHNLIGYPSL